MPVVNSRRAVEGIEVGDLRERLGFELPSNRFVLPVDDGRFVLAYELATTFKCVAFEVDAFDLTQSALVVMLVKPATQISLLRISHVFAVLEKFDELWRRLLDRQPLLDWAM